MERLERHRGHFYNWYDTRDLKPLLPYYVSTVDSGNLAGHLITLSSGLNELPDKPILNRQIFVGLSDTLGILRELAGSSPELESIAVSLANPPTDLPNAYLLLEGWSRRHRA